MVKHKTQYEARAISLNAWQLYARAVRWVERGKGMAYRCLLPAVGLQPQMFIKSDEQKKNKKSEAEQIFNFILWKN